MLPKAVAVPLVELWPTLDTLGGASLIGQWLVSSKWKLFENYILRLYIMYDMLIWILTRHVYL